MDEDRVAKLENHALILLLLAASERATRTAIFG